MLSNSDLIPGIYNFCDSWCERCRLTSRCRSFQMQQQVATDQPVDTNASLVDQLTEALNMTKRYIEKLQSENPSLLVNGPSEAEQQTLEEQVLIRRHRTKEHPVATLASVYLQQTGAWLRDERRLLELAGRQQLQQVNLGLRTEDQAMVQLTALKNAYEQIKWYRTLIPVKTMATLRALDEPTNDEYLLDYYNGKAKLVLVSIDRSIASWQTILYYYPEKLDGMLDMLAGLNRLTSQLEALFPTARAFKRPGLD
ncbi:hypothetical protein FAES_0884 [Fibrella aestuarina BUZ 2]|uniref:Uncharacterized protein n=1 Tax=Fibrella aestuarina BUZ 2 TaxID=1166018 RepID=I0K442_9BACT|nr:hypothetical protein [Fibrella aestuarina]CCG98895.1 hypothetical protein FAES_0884 [Fibrella aestuarina BUZ 2]